MYENIELFIEYLVSGGYSEHTTSGYEIHLRHFYSFCNQKEVDYLRINNKDLFKYRGYLSRQYSNQTVNSRLSAIKQFYNFLIDMEEIDFNPIGDNLYLRTRKSNPNPLSPEHKALLIQYIEGKEKHIELGFKLLLDTGLRISELVALEKKDIIFIQERAFIKVEKGKGAKKRIVPIFTKELLEDLLLYMEEVQVTNIFQVGVRAFQLHAQGFSELVGIPFTIHQTRHTFATEKLNEGMRIDILQKLLGHSDITTTMYYAETTDLQIIKLGVAINEQHVK